MTDLRKTPTELREEVLHDDEMRDVSIYIVVPIAVLAALSAAAGLCAMIMMRALVYFRQDVDAYFLTCAPFLFPVITGLFVAYKKQFGMLNVHLSTTLMALLLGGFGLAVSIEPIFVHPDRCRPSVEELNCHKPALSYLYMVSGCASAALAVLGVLATFIGIYTASGRIAVRKHEALLQHMHDVEEHQKQLRLMGSHDVVLKRRARALSRSSADHHYLAHIITLQREVEGLPQSVLEDLGPKVDGPNTKLIHEENNCTKL